MNNNLLVILLVGHFLGDYYFQNDRLAEGKKDKLGHLFLHGLIYLVINLLLVAPLANNKVAVLVLLITMGHIAIDLIKFSVTKVLAGKSVSKIVRKLKQWDEQGLVYCVDQLLHIGFLIIVGLIYVNVYGSVGRWYWPFGSWAISNDVLRYVLAILIILKPTNITFRALFEQNKPSDKRTFVKDLNTGKRIGNMERLMIFAFLALGQYTAIGLVFTAKSFTRYKRIADDTAFAEYYLLGTLFSILATLVVYIGIFIIA